LQEEDELKTAFPGIVPIQRPLIENQKIKDRRLLSHGKGGRTN
jgi:hypothetical protein